MKDIMTNFDIAERELNIAQMELKQQFVLMEAASDIDSLSGNYYTEEGGGKKTNFFTKIISKIKEIFEKFKKSITEFFSSKETKDAVSGTQKAMQANPELKKKKISFPPIDKLSKANEEAAKKIQNAKTPEEAQQIVADYNKKTNILLGAGAAVTVTLGAVALWLGSGWKKERAKSQAYGDAAMTLAKEGQEATERLNAALAANKKNNADYSRDIKAANDLIGNMARKAEADKAKNDESMKQLRMMHGSMKKQRDRLINANDEKDKTIAKLSESNRKQNLKVEELSMKVSLLQNKCSALTEVANKSIKIFNFINKHALLKTTSVGKAIKGDMQRISLTNSL
jgi:hypothetical protein